MVSLYICRMGCLDNLYLVGHGEFGVRVSGGHGSEFVAQRDEGGLGPPDGLDGPFGVLGTGPNRAPRQRGDTCQDLLRGSGTPEG